MTTRMENADADLPVDRVELEDVFTTIEPEPITKPRKQRADIFATSDKPRYQLPPCAPLVYAHATVLFSAGDNVIRQRALDELKRLMNDEDDNGAVAVMRVFTEWKKA